MKRRVCWTIIGAAISFCVYTCSFLVILSGQRFNEWDDAPDFLTYSLSRETGDFGIQYFGDHPWMKIYYPLGKVVYEQSDDPHAFVTFNAWGKFVYATGEWGWTGRDWETSYQEAEDYRGWTYSEWFPESFEWKSAGESRYPVPD